MEKSLEERIRYLEDVKEINDLMCKYCYSMDKGEWSDVLSYFAKECSCNFGHFSRGECGTRKEVENFFQSIIMSPLAFAFFIHRIMNGVINVQDETHATANWYLDEPCILHETKRAAWNACTYYVDFVKEGGKWLFSRVAVSDWCFSCDYEKGWEKEPFTVPGSWLPEDITRDQERVAQRRKELEKS